MDNIFRLWVPKKLKFPILLALAIALCFSSGIPSTIYPYIIGDQAAISADLSMAMYAYCAGMVCSIPLIFRLTLFMPKKQIIIISIILLMVINGLLSINPSPLLNVMLMFSFGCIKIIVTMAMISELMPYLMPTGERYQMYAIYYPMNMIFPVIGGLISAHLAASYFWEMGYHFQNLMLAGCLLLALLSFRTQVFKRIPLFQYDWFGTIILAASLLSFSFVASYGLQENWLSSKSILIGICCFVAFSLLFFNLNVKKKRKIISFKVIGQKSTFLTLLTVFLLGLFYSNTSLISNLMNVILPGNPTKQAEVNSYVILGYALGSAIVYIYFKITKKVKMIILLAAALYLLSNILCFRLINSNTPITYLILPIILRGMAIIISFIATAVYLAANVTGKAFLHSIVLFILVRTFLVTVFWSSFLSNWYYSLQVFYQTRMAERMGIPQSVDGSFIAAVQKQVNVLALQDIYLYLCLINVVILMIIAFLPYHSSTVRHIFNWQTKKNAKELIQATPVN